MTYPTFSNGQVLPASDLNAIGLWLVKSQTVGTGVSSVTVTGAFSADYDNYRIVISNCNTPAAISVHFTLNNRTGNTYGFGGRYLSYGGASADATGATQPHMWLGVGGSNFGAQFDLMNVSAATVTTCTFLSSSTTYGNYGGGYSTATSASTAITIYPASGTLTGGTISVYGYRKA